MRRLALVFIALAGLLMTAFEPPAGRPPVGPLQRVQPKLYDVRMQVSVFSYDRYDIRDGGPFRLKDTPIVVPLVLNGTYNKIDRRSLRAFLYKDNLPVKGFAEHARLESDHPMHTHLAIMPVDEFHGNVLQWQLEMRAKSWSSAINDAAAAQVTWPKEFPEEVHDALKPQRFIESDHEIFTRAVQDASQGKLRLVPPYIAAKELVRYCLNNIKVVGDGIHHGEHGTIHGLELSGALQTAQRGRGSPHDLVCVCVATLRAAGIPARPVIGVVEKPGPNTERTELVSWAEFYLPDAGWIPFDPEDMQGQGIRHQPVNQPWPEFGTMDDLHDRVTVSYHFMPERNVQSPMYPSVWAWDPKPGTPRYTRQAMTLTLISRGQGAPDPQ